MAYASRQVLFLPFSPLDPSRILPFRQPEFLVMHDPFPSPARPWGEGDVAHLMVEHTGDGQPGNIQPVVGLGNGDQVARAFRGAQFLVGGEPPDPRRPAHHSFQPALEVDPVQFLEQFLEIQCPAQRTSRWNLVEKSGSDPCEYPAFDVLAVFARPGKRVERGPDPFPQIGLDLRGGTAERFGNLAHPDASFLHQPPPFPSAAGIHQRHRGVFGGNRTSLLSHRSGRRSGRFAPEEIQDELHGGADHGNRSGIIRSIRLRTGAKLRRWRAQGP